MLLPSGNKTGQSVTGVCSDDRRLIPHDICIKLRLSLHHWSEDFHHLLHGAHAVHALLDHTGGPAVRPRGDGEHGRETRAQHQLFGFHCIYPVRIRGRAEGRGFR